MVRLAARKDYGMKLPVLANGRYLLRSSIQTKHFDELRNFAKVLERIIGRLGIGVYEIDEEHVLPGLAAYWPRFDFAQIDLTKSKNA